MIDDTTSSDATITDSFVYKLKRPFTIGKDNPIQYTELVVKARASALRDFKYRLDRDGSMTIEPYNFAAIGVRMAGETTLVLDAMHICDINGLALEVFGFLTVGHPIGLNT